MRGECPKGFDVFRKKVGVTDGSMGDDVEAWLGNRETVQMRGVVIMTIVMAQRSQISDRSDGVRCYRDVTYKQRPVSLLAEIYRKSDWTD